MQLPSMAVWSSVRPPAGGRLNGEQCLAICQEQHVRWARAIRLLKICKRPLADGSRDGEQWLRLARTLQASFQANASDVRLARNMANLNGG